MGHEDFAKPPVTEVSMGAVFSPLPQFSQAHIGLFWDVIRKDYPHVEDQAPIKFVQNPSLSQGLQLKLTFQQLPPFRRVLFSSNDSDRLIQMQQDALIVNWRKRTNPYPRYDSLRREFKSIWSKFLEVLDSHGQEYPQLSQAQVVYSNEFALEPGDSFGIFSSSDSVNRPSDEYGFVHAPIREQAVWESSVRFGSPVRTEGTLTCHLMRGGLQDALGVDDSNVFFRQVFQASRQTDEIDEFLRTCDDGHDLIVENFSNLLSPKLRRTFGGNR